MFAAPSETALATPAPDSSAVARRAALVRRSAADAAPPSWRTAAASAGVSGADAFLCDLSSRIAAALQTVPVSSEAARDLLRSARETLIRAVNARCDVLEGHINAAERSKIVALERELCAVDVALERWRAERGAAAEAASSLNDAELAGRNAELTDNLDAAEALLLALPTTVVEPPRVGIDVRTLDLEGAINDVGRVMIPLAVTVADLALKRVPHRVAPGRTPATSPCTPGRHACLAV